MVTCSIRYEIDPAKVQEFEQYARMWISLVRRFGGIHHGYFLPSEGANDIAYALFSFEILAAYEQYRQDSARDAACQEAFAYAAQTGCVRRYERTFLRPILE